MTRLIFLQGTEISGDYPIRPKNYENSRKNIFGLSVLLALKVKNRKILTFKVIFLLQKRSIVYFYLADFSSNKGKKAWL